MKLDFTYDAALVSSSDNVVVAGSVAASASAESQSITSPSADDLNLKIASVKVGFRIFQIIFFFSSRVLNFQSVWDSATSAMVADYANPPAEVSDLVAAENAAINSTAELMSAAVLTEEHSERQNKVAVTPMQQSSDGHQPHKDRERGVVTSKPQPTVTSASNVAKVRPQQHQSNLFSDDCRANQFDQMSSSIAAFQVELVN